MDTSCGYPNSIPESWETHRFLVSSIGCGSLLQSINLEFCSAGENAKNHISSPLRA